jgi:hypothetical protein
MKALKLLKCRICFLPALENSICGAGLVLTFHSNFLSTEIHKHKFITLFNYISSKAVLHFALHKCKHGVTCGMKSLQIGKDFTHQVFQKYIYPTIPFFN